METEGSRRRPRKSGTEAIGYKVFTCHGVGFVWGKHQMVARWNETRNEALAFINDRVGVENVISVSETNWGESHGFSVAVWYRQSGSSIEALNLDGFAATDDDDLT